MAGSSSGTEPAPPPPPRWAVDPGDVLALLGVGLLATGLGLWSVPLMLVVLGCLFLAAALWRNFYGTGDVAPRPPAPPEG